MLRRARDATDTPRAAGGLTGRRALAPSTDRAGAPHLGGRHDGLAQVLGGRVQALRLAGGQRWRGRSVQGRVSARRTAPGAACGKGREAPRQRSSSTQLRSRPRARAHLTPGMSSAICSRRGMTPTVDTVTFLRRLRERAGRGARSREARPQWDAESESGGGSPRVPATAAQARAPAGHTAPQPAAPSRRFPGAARTAAATAALVCSQAQVAFTVPRQTSTHRPK